MPKDSGRTELSVTQDELRELWLAVGLRIAHLSKINTSKLNRSEKADLRRHLELTKGLHDTLRAARGK